MTPTNGMSVLTQDQEVAGEGYRLSAVEQIVTKLRQIDVLVAAGRTMGQACKEAEITGQGYYRWGHARGALFARYPLPNLARFCPTDAGTERRLAAKTCQRP